MNKEWSEKNKEFQKLISKEAAFKDGIKMLLELRSCVFEQITQIVNGYPENAFYEMPGDEIGDLWINTIYYIRNIKSI